MSVTLADRHGRPPGGGAGGGMAGHHGQSHALGPHGALDDDERNRGVRGVSLVPPPAATPLVDFLKDEVVDICAALANAGSLLRRLGLVPEAARLEALFRAVEERLAEAPGPLRAGLVSRPR